MVETLTSNPLAKLNSEQKQAVSLGFGPALVIAGAGSGKTLVLTQRIMYLINELGQSPYSILAVTFTNKAASEMKVRISRFLNEYDVNSLTLGTFHSICSRILRQDIEHLNKRELNNLSSNFVIYNESDSLSVLKKIIHNLNLDETVYDKKDIKFQISNLKADGLSYNKAIEKAGNYRQEKIAHIYRLYQIELAQNNALDFDDLIFYTLELFLTNEEVLQKWQRRYQHILVDEFQDTSRSQYELIKILANEKRNYWDNASIMAVGDIDQSIYSWRKADYKVVLDYQKDFAQNVLIKLEDNYRSKRVILDAANSIIKNNHERIDKVLRCNRDDGSKIGLYEASNEIDEARYVIDRIKRLRYENISLKDCVILYRTNAQSRAFEEIAFSNQIPYKIIGASRFYDRAEIRDVMAYLKLIYNSRDGQAFNRAIANPKRGIGDVSLTKLEEFARANNLGMLEASLQAQNISTLSKKNQETLNEFARLISSFKFLEQSMPIDELIETIIGETGYRRMLEKQASEEKGSNANSPMENIAELISSAKEFVQDFNDANLENYLARISLLSDLDSLKESSESLSLMTIHLAKGLEYDQVFLVGLEEKTLPHLRSIDNEKALEEERRLMYVAVTRAKNQLFLSYSKERMINLRSKDTNRNTCQISTIPSRFLLEISPELLNRHNSPDTTIKYNFNNLAKTNFSNNSTRTNRDIVRAPGPAGPARIGINNFKQTPIATAGGINKTNLGNQDRTGYETNFAIGDLVMHDKFGLGKIVSVIGQVNKMYNISFKNIGTRLIDPKISKLDKIPK